MLALLPGALPSLVGGLWLNAPERLEHRGPGSGDGQPRCMTRATCKNPSVWLDSALSTPRAPRAHCRPGQVPSQPHCQRAPEAQDLVCAQGSPAWLAPTMAQGLKSTHARRASIVPTYAPLPPTRPTNSSMGPTGRGSRGAWGPPGLPLWFSPTPSQVPGRPGLLSTLC